MFEDDVAFRTNITTMRLSGKQMSIYMTIPYPYFTSWNIGFVKRRKVSEARITLKWVGGWVTKDVLRLD